MNTLLSGRQFSSMKVDEAPSSPESQSKLVQLSCRYLDFPILYRFFLIFDRHKYNSKNWHPSQNTQQDDQDQNQKRHVLKMSYGRAFCQILRIELNNCKACLLAISHKLTTLHTMSTPIFFASKSGYTYIHTYCLLYCWSFLIFCDLYHFAANVKEHN